MEQLKVSLALPNHAAGQLVQTRFESRTATLLVEFPNEGTTDLPVGQVVRLTVAGAGLEKDVVLPARPVFHSRGELSLYHFQVGLVEGAVIGHAMNRRDEVRVRPDPFDNVTVLARDYATDTVCEPELYDISATGLGLLISLQEESSFASAWRLELSLSLPGEEGGPAGIEGEVLYRKLEGSAIRLGVRFVPPKGDEPNESLERIRSYVDQRRAELLRLVREHSEHMSS